MESDQPVCKKCDVKTLFPDLRWCPFVRCCSPCFPSGTTTCQGRFVSLPWISTGGLGIVWSCGCGCQNQWDPILGVGEFTTRFRTYFSGWIESDVHRGLTDLAFDPRQTCLGSAGRPQALGKCGLGENCRFVQKEHRRARRSSPG